MNPLLYSLCQKPALGLVLQAVALCGFDPLFKDVALKLDSAGSVATASITVPVDLKYALMLEMSTHDGAPLSKQEVQILGADHAQHCSGNIDYNKIPQKERAELGRPIPFKVEVRRKSDNGVLLQREITSLCAASRWSNLRTRTLIVMELPRGEYSVRIENVAAQAGMERLNARLLLAP